MLSHLEPITDKEQLYNIIEKLQHVIKDVIKTETHLQECFLNIDCREHLKNEGVESEKGSTGFILVAESGSKSFLNKKFNYHSMVRTRFGTFRCAHEEPIDIKDYSFDLSTKRISLALDNLITAKALLTDSLNLYYKEKQKEEQTN